LESDWRWNVYEKGLANYRRPGFDANIGLLARVLSGPWVGFWLGKPDNAGFWALFQELIDGSLALAGPTGPMPGFPDRFPGGWDVTPD